MGNRCGDGTTAWTVKVKKGAPGAPFFLTGEAAYRFLPAFFFPPLAAFFAIALIPPFTVGFRVRRASTARRTLPPGTPACRSRRSSPSVETPACAGDLQPKKLGVSVLDTPTVVRRKRLALLARLLLSALCSLLSHDSSLEFGSSANFPTLYCYNRWAERSTLIQDVDYG